MKINELLVALENSVFNRVYGEYDASSGGIKSFNEQLSAFTSKETPTDAKYYLLQDDSNWNTPMKQAYILNLLGGMKSTITLFSTNEEPYKVIDGLQGAIAIHQFTEGEFTLECGLGIKDILSIKGIRNINRLPTFNMKFKLYDFDSKKEELQFYIDVTTSF